MRGVSGLMAELENVQSCTLCSPTGGGKSLMVGAMIGACDLAGKRSAVLTNRRILTQQLAEGFDKQGIEFGVVAASMPGRYDQNKPHQICSVPTLLSRGGKLKADIVFIDEAHMQLGPEATQLYQDLMAAGVHLVPVSATPLGCKAIAPKIVVAGKNSELRACGAHVPAIVKGLHEMDVSSVRRVREVFEYGSIVETAWCQAVVGDIFEDYVRFNPQQRPALCTAPGVPESRALAQYFHSRGIRSAHLSAGEVWIDGSFYNDKDDGRYRNRIFDLWRSGEVKVVMHCQVLKEAFDFIDLYHLILATPICSLVSYVQQVGRVIRYSPNTPDHVLVSDHAGNSYRHGSPNEDRDWEHLYHLTETEIRQEQEKRNNSDSGSDEDVPAVCPKCGTMVRPNGKCPPPPVGCGEEIDRNNPRKLRFIRQESGSLKEIPDASLKKQGKKVSLDSVAQKRWNGLYWASKNSKSSRAMTFNQLKAAYKREYGEYPPPGLKFMPKRTNDWKRQARDVSIKYLQMESNAQNTISGHH